MLPTSRMVYKRADGGSCPPTLSPNATEDTNLVDEGEKWKYKSFIYCRATEMTINFLVYCVVSPPWMLTSKTAYSFYIGKGLLAFEHWFRFAWPSKLKSHMKIATSNYYGDKQNCGMSEHMPLTYVLLLYSLPSLTWISTILILRYRTSAQHQAIMYMYQLTHPALRSIIKTSFA